MKSLSAHLQDYLNLRRELGFKMQAPAGLLSRFVQFAKKRRAFFITTKVALAWATGVTDCQPAQWGNRLGMVRRFAQYVSGIDPRTEIPAQDLLPYRFQRKTPYLYNDKEVCTLIQAIRQLPAPGHLRSATHATLIGLLAVTGMRVSEAIGLDRKDVNLRQGMITVWRSKFGKSRLVPVHHTTKKQLLDYARLRDRVCAHAVSPSFFISEQGTRLNICTLRHWFIVASKKIGLRGPTDSHGPRLHDLRHRFAFKTILGWYRRGADVEAHLPELTTFLGHGHVADTYWYISSSPELLKLATQRLEQSHKRGLRK